MLWTVIQKTSFIKAAKNIWNTLKKTRPPKLSLCQPKNVISPKHPKVSCKGLIFIWVLELPLYSGSLHSIVLPSITALRENSTCFRPAAVTTRPDSRQTRKWNVSSECMSETPLLYDHVCQILDYWSWKGNCMTISDFKYLLPICQLSCLWF